MNNKVRFKIVKTPNAITIDMFPNRYEQIYEYLREQGLDEPIVEDLAHEIYHNPPSFTAHKFHYRGYVADTGYQVCVRDTKQEVIDFIKQQYQFDGLIIEFIERGFDSVNAIARKRIKCPRCNSEVVVNYAGHIAYYIEKVDDTGDVDVSDEVYDNCLYHQNVYCPGCYTEWDSPYDFGEEYNSKRPIDSDGNYLD
jgi:hypothetical protein